MIALLCFKVTLHLNLIYSDLWSQHAWSQLEGKRASAPSKWGGGKLE